MSIDLILHYLSENILKLWAMLIPTGFFVLTANEGLVVQLLFITLGVDVILGMTLALKVRRFNSVSMGRVIPKFIAYGAAIITLLTISKLLPMPVGLSYYVMSFFILRELTSNIELLSLLGVHFPNKFMILLNKEYTNRDDAKKAWIGKNSMFKK